LLTGKPVITGDTLEEVWALKDVSFEIKRGEAVGIIGRNGAGKSTLLKILSRITEPTEGRVTIRGRVASLLEVGTGFHSELTGRENIYLNGTILGMTRAEIKRKFDEIVAFSEVERYLDTPVKRYSSGMYVRLAFSVAAHLEPEILVVDEVLAVGDAAFQKKCLGKMEDVAHEGRTVLFVSHNMAAINAICEKSILLQSGTIRQIGSSADIVSLYLQSDVNKGNEIKWICGIGDETFRLFRVCLKNIFGYMSNQINIQEPFYIEFEFEVGDGAEDIRLGFRIISSEGCIVLTSEDGDYLDVSKREPGRYIISAIIPENFLNSGLYYVTVGAHVPMKRIICFENECLSFMIERTGGIGGPVDDGRKGVVRPLLQWRYNDDQVIPQ